MAVKTSTLGGVELTGQDASKFVRQFTYGRPNDKAKESAKRGKELLEQFHQNGGVVTFPAK